MEEIVLLKQDSLAKEKFSRNEVQKDVHIVAKNLPFTIEIASSAINLATSRIYARLYYDADNDLDFKPVDFVKHEPMTYKVFADVNGTKATIEFRVAVLTSQHEDSLFRIKIGALVNDAPVEIWSESIRVVSKPSQVNKIKRGRTPAPAAGLVKPASPTSPVVLPTNVPLSSCAKKVSSASDPVLEAIQRLEQTQRQQNQIMEKLLSQQKIPDPDDMDFEVAFKKFLASYDRVPLEDRPNKIRKVMDNLNKDQHETLGDFVREVNTPAQCVVEPPVKHPLTLSGLLNFDHNGAKEWESFSENWNPLETVDAIQHSHNKKKNTKN